MIPGLSIEILLTVHVAVSLIGIATGLVAMPALAAGRWLGGWQAAFLITTALTSITGFLFPFSGVTPAFLFGVISMLALAVTAATWPFRAQRAAAGIAYAVTATLALYLNLFVLIVQSFQKVPALQPLAPTQSEPPFAIAQLVLLLAALGVGFFAVRAARRPAVATAA
ncbi:conserved membrane hypothetical protein [Hyphomicrobiales bacterium]|nr:conserved membrane hypothetical protein [Hyphomicrobiales bacterium]CAH1698580.1 conserved membrane hypothetical protein [Hyphomicrobiales bacterium]CAI0342227.1 conserved membrane hypothetical protein [Hyphomicrobiales bacterium]